ncbi:hypothetical protein EV702DRAFT_1042326 [Suillus placidus]|uniref:Uncharacterized protein n=1 Tax=Suillus placidus TaxID=48579 RepID=A0A9P7A2C9_9AGAM|nr:hypothetical protein EV702DRAFT_1042326 [Suillus placidus]
MLPCSSEGIIESPDLHDHRKRLRFQDISFQGDDRSEDLESPSKRVKTLITTWTYTSPPDTSNYFNKRMLEFSRMTRRAFAARIRYQRLRSHELELMKSIVDNEIQRSKTQMVAIDLQIGSTEGMLRDAGVDIESKECKLSKDNIRMFSGDDHGSEADWQEDDSCDVTISFASGSGSLRVR